MYLWLHCISLSGAESGCSEDWSTLSADRSIAAALFEARESKALEVRLKSLIAHALPDAADWCDYNVCDV